MSSSDNGEGRTFVYVCLNDDCCKRGSETVYEALKAKSRELEGVEIREYICFGNCDYGANTVVYPDRVWFSGLRKDSAPVVLAYLEHGQASSQHTGMVDEELADTTWELLELDLSDEGEDEESEPSRVGNGTRSS